MRSAAGWQIVLALATPAGACVASGCSPNSICAVAGPINDPSNRTLRRNIMSFGLGQFCQQMTTRDAPLTLSPDAPIVGRFFPQHCTQQVLDNGDLWVQFDGFGYAWTSLSRKVTFTSTATIQYNQDFKCAEDDGIYAYFDSRAVSPPDFRILQIEQPVANLVQNWIAPFADNFGRQVVSGQLAQGFTVIEHAGGNIEFGIGHLPLGQHPPHPFDLHGSSRVTYENLRTAVYGGERDFIGPISIEGFRRAIFLHMHLEGVQSADVFVVPKAEGDPSLLQYVQYGAAGALAFMPRFSDVIRYGQEYERAVPVPPGMYYVVIDNTPSAGQVAPPPAPLMNVLGPPAAVVNYAIQIGDAP
ncbi:MAG TPA: hypothetical protein VEK07_19625 [Polyangiaceae bacterium]|nr:hypothetical protein [Polyangiaceae bacterium]